MSKYRSIAALTILALLLTLLPVGALAAIPSDPTGNPAPVSPQLTQVNVAGSFESEIGGGDWSNNDPLTDMADANGDGVWKFEAAIPVAGPYTYKIVEDGDWSKAYPASDVPFTVNDGETVKWYYDPTDHYTADSINQVIPAVVGNFPSAIGGADWSPDNLMTLMKGPDAGGTVYTYRAKNLPEGDYEFKVALGENWDENYGANGEPNGPNIPLAIPAGGGDAIFSYDLMTHIISAEVLPPSEPPPPPPAQPDYLIIHYNRPAGDYGTPSADFNTYWGLHLWGEAIAASEGTAWTSPKPFFGVDDYGAYVAIKLQDKTKPVNYIIHKGNDKDTPADRSVIPADIPELWLKQGDPNNYASRAAVEGKTVIHYKRADGDYTGWGLHLWGDGLDPTEVTQWGAPKQPTGMDDYGAYFEIKLTDPTKALNFIVHKGDAKDPDNAPDRSYTPADNDAVWLQSGDVAVYMQRGAAEDYAIIHYRRVNGDYDGWGLHVWEDAAEPDVTWANPLQPAGTDDFGIFWKVRLKDNPVKLNYIVHKGDTKDPGPDQSLILAEKGFEIWLIQGSAEQYTDPATAIADLNNRSKGNLGQQKAYWVDRDTLLWDVAANAAYTFKLHYDMAAGLALTEAGVTGGQSITLTPDPNGNTDAIKAKFPHLAALPALKIADADLAKVADILKGQFAIAAYEGTNLVDATGLQIPGVLDDLYTYNGELGVNWAGNVPTLRLWAPTAQSVKLHLFDDGNPATTSTVLAPYFTPDSGVWTITGDASWKGKFYLYEVKVFAPSTGKIETNLVTDPYSFSLSTNSKRSQIVDLSDAALAPTGWASLAKPELKAPEDISIYEVQVRDFSANDPSVPDNLKGTYKAFTLPNSNGVQHLKALEAAGLSHLHLLPVFDIATINENKAEWQQPDEMALAALPADSDQQQALIDAVRDADPYNWGYDPLHYTTPEGSYATNPEGTTRIVEFREMVEAINQMGLRVVMDVVYNHTNSAGQAPNSVLDRIVPGYYHRLNATGQVETSTCCANTASEHNMFEKLMVDSLVTWARQYKIDAFRFDLMGHHMKRNMLKVRAALDALTLANDGVDGKSIYLYGEGWNFGEVADNARGENATQLNMAGTGIGTFSDRLRDAVRGISPFAAGAELTQNQGFANGSYYDTKPTVPGTADEQKARLLLQTDQVRVGMAGNLADYLFVDRNGELVKGSAVDYNGQPAGYTADPQENISYIDKHDNQTLYDINAYALPVSTSMADRVRVEAVGRSTILLGQGVPFIQAGGDLLRSKSLDRDSYNSGDWFNKIDWTGQTNNFGVGLPPAWSNSASWDVQKPLLANPALKPSPADIQKSAALFQELLAIRYSSPLFRLPTAAEIQRRLVYLNTGPDQLPGLIVMALSDHLAPDIDPNYETIVVLINANDEAQTFTAPAAARLGGRRLALHPVQANGADPVVKTATYDWKTGKFTIPARTTAVWVEKQLGPDALVTFPGDYVSEIGGQDWTPGDVTTKAADPNGDDVWTFTTTGLPKGSYQFKATVGGTWDESYGKGGAPGGDNIPFTVATDNAPVTFYYDASDNYVFSRPDGIIPVAAGDFASEIGGQDWTPSNLTTWLKDPDGDGVYTFSTGSIPAGDWQFKVALNEGWDEAYPGGNVAFTVPAGGAQVTFSFTAATKEVKVDVEPFAEEPPPPPGPVVTFPGSYPEAAGLGPNWSPDNLQTQGADANADGVYKFTTDKIPPGNYEFKVTVNKTWDENYGQGGVAGGPNVPFTVETAGQQVTFYYDRGAGDNWVAVRPPSRIVALVGSLMSEAGGADWSPDNLKGWMKNKKDGDVYEITLTLPAGAYEYKVAVNESWDENYGKDGKPGGDNIPLVVPPGGATVTFTFNDTTKQIRDSINNPPNPGPDGDIWWDGLGHDSRDALYRTPFGAVTHGTQVRLRFRTYANDATGVGVRVADLLHGGATTYRMTKVATVPATPFAYDFWEATFTAPSSNTVLQYVFGAVDGDKIVYYGDDAKADGGWGTASATNQVTPYDIYVYDAAFTAPDWAKNATIYQIFPDRFRNGDKANDPTAADWFYPAERGHAWPIAPWNTIVPDPEPFGPENPWRSTYSSTFYGGDLAGVIEKLDYLKSLGVTAIYFNPIFDSPSNHRYDGRDYMTISPALGDLALFQTLDTETEKRGMKLILDMVPNHVSSDSIYFDRFGRHPEVGACESVDSPYRAWFYFSPASPAGTGVCAGDTNYVGWFGVETLPKVNTTNVDAVREFWMRSDDAVAKYWLNNGADGYRVDVAPEIAPSFFEEWRPILSATKADVQTYSETWSESDVRPMVLGDKFDSTMNYRFANALLSFLRDTPFSDNDGNLALNPLKPSEFANALKAIQEDYPAPAWETAMNLLDSHDTNRAVVKLDHDGITGAGANRTPVNGFTDGKTRLQTVALLQFTLPGAPTVYYGDEVGLAGFGSDVPRDDPYNRQPYPWADEPGYTQLPDWRKADDGLLATYQALGQMRAKYSFLRTGSFDVLAADDAANTLAYGRKNGDGVAVVIVNRSKTSQVITVPLNGYLPNDLVLTNVAGSGSATVTDGKITLSVNGLWGAVLVHVGAVVAPAAPQNLKATGGEGVVELSWQAVAGATGYQVFRSYLSGGGYALIAEVSGATYTDLAVTNGAHYYYVVKAVMNGMVSAASDEARATPEWIIGGVLIQWPPEITHTIKAGQATEPIYARIFVQNETLKAGPIEGISFEVGFGPLGTLPQTWDTWQPLTYHQDYVTEDPDLKEWEEWMGVVYPDRVGEFGYLVRASSDGGETWFYAGLRAGTDHPGRLHVVPSADRTLPAALTNLHVTGSTPDSISLAWDASTEADIWGYEMYRQAADGTWARIGAVLAPTTTFVDREVNTGASYRYYVVAVDTSYNRSARSNIVDAVAEARMVQVSFNVTVPGYTPAGDTVYLVGNQDMFGPWTPDLWAMTRTGPNTWTTTVELLDGTALQYKYTRGSWDKVEWWGTIVDVNNRTLTVSYGTDGKQPVNDTVELWRDPLVVSTDPANGAVNVALDKALKVVFSRPVTPETLTDRVVLTSFGAPVAGAFAFDAATNTLTFTPAAPLQQDRTYKLTLKAGIVSDANAGLQNDYVLTFATGATITETRRVLLPVIFR